MNQQHKAEVAIAILHQNGKFLMQLRDDIPTIIFPGHWAFFGGHIEPGEEPQAGVYRELMEEIGYTPPQLAPFKRWDDGKVIRHFFHGPLTVGLDALALNEGQDKGLCTVEEIHRGLKYSPVTGDERPLGEPHQQILLSYLETYNLLAQ
ncbi:MAG: NUDIX domain-containing protein [Leptolyngbya sp. SIO4C1]|nr:NUDIX domain-containing protein [Leptolyngbya sp. SIO4C1]